MKTKLLSTLFILMLSISAFAAGNLYEQLHGTWTDGNFIITIDSKNNRFTQKLSDGHVFAEGSIFDVKVKSDRVVQFNVGKDQITFDFIDKNSFSLGTSTTPFKRVQ